MPIPFIDLKTLHEGLSTSISEAIQKVLTSSQFIGGELVEQFEKEFAEYLGVDFCQGVGNGTDALEIALKSLGVGPGDEVIVPALSWISSCSAVLEVGATVKFVDVDPHSGGLNPDLLEEAITNRTRVIMAVHLYGIPLNMPRILKVAEKHGLSVLEDCAQAHGAEWEGRKVGTWGNMATFSFYPTKNLGAMGDGGCMVTNDEHLAAACRRYANYGQQGKNCQVERGRNSRLDPIQAAILSAKLPHLDQWNQYKRQIVHWYTEGLKNADVDLPLPGKQATSVWYVFPIRTENRDELQNYLNSQGIGTAVHYPLALPDQPIFRSDSKATSEFPVARAWADHELSLPAFLFIEEKQVNEVCQHIEPFIHQISQ